MQEIRKHLSFIDSTTAFAQRARNPQAINSALEGGDKDNFQIALGRLRTIATEAGHADAMRKLEVINHIYPF